MAAADDQQLVDEALPFANVEFAVEIDSEVHPIVNFQKGHGHKHKPRTTKSRTKLVKKDDKALFYSNASSLFFEHSQEENNILSLVPYTGPSNTAHLQSQLYLPQLVSPKQSDSSVAFGRFAGAYEQVVQSMASSSNEMKVAMYLRFGISYVIYTDPMIDRTLPLKDFIALRARGRGIRSAFYSCKGVTTPKRLVTALSKLNYTQVSSNVYSYDVQLSLMKSNPPVILHFQYDEKFQCQSIFSREGFPINFDFIRDKSASRFTSIDNSYADMFDFRVQISSSQHLKQTDPLVLKVLQGVPLDEVLLIDQSTSLLNVAAKLRPFVKYLKCTRSSDYRSIEEQIMINMGTYEEYQPNEQGSFETSMTAENIMTIEFLDQQSMPSAKRFFEIGMWFSQLCQTCVDLPASAKKRKNVRRSCKWFSDILNFSKQKNTTRTVSELTKYRAVKNNRSYTSEELSLVKKILAEENLRKILIDSNEETIDEKELRRTYESIRKRLETSAAPGADRALRKIQQAYRLICEEFD